MLALLLMLVATPPMASRQPFIVPSTAVLTDALTVDGENQWVYRKNKRVAATSFVVIKVTWELGRGPIPIRQDFAAVAGDTVWDLYLEGTDREATIFVPDWVAPGEVVLVRTDAGGWLSLSDENRREILDSARSASAFISVTPGPQLLKRRAKTRNYYLVAKREEVAVKP